MVAPSIAPTLLPPCAFTSTLTPTPPLSLTHCNSLSIIWIRSLPIFFFLGSLSFLFLNDMFFSLLFFSFLVVISVFVFVLGFVSVILKEKIINLKFLRL